MPSTRVFPFSTAGATLIVEEAGRGDTLFVLVHGIGMGRRVFAELGTHLAQHGRVWGIDQPGYGDAPEPTRIPTIERVANMIAALLRARAGGARVVVIGHSMGAQVAAELGARHPHLVERLVLAGPSVDPAAPTAIGQAVRLARDLAIESPRVFVRGGREFLRAGPHLRRKMRAMLAHRIADAVARCPQPVLVLRGTSDVVSPRAWCAALAFTAADGRLREIDGHGHETFIRDPAPAAREIIEFALSAAR